MYSFCLPNLLKECWRLRLNFCTVDKFPLLLRSVAIDESGFCWLFPFPPCMRTTSPPENEENYDGDDYSEKVVKWLHPAMQTVIWRENCRKYCRLENKGNYGDFYVKWVNLELHIVIWRKNKSHIYCRKCCRDFVTLDVNYFPAWK
jgi:hypothetical protein